MKQTYKPQACVTACVDSLAGKGDEKLGRYPTANISHVWNRQQRMSHVREVKQEMSRGRHVQVGDTRDVQQEMSLGGDKR